MKSRSKALRQLARERSKKKDSEAEARNEVDDDSDDSLNQRGSIKKSKHDGESLLSNLPEPMHSKSAPAFDLLSEFIDDPEDENGGHHERAETEETYPTSDMIEVDVSKLIREPLSEPIVTKTSIDDIKMPKSKEKEKNQITHLARLAKAAESVIHDNALLSRANKAAARSKYGW